MANNNYDMSCHQDNDPLEMVDDEVARIVNKSRETLDNMWMLMLLYDPLLYKNNN